MPGDLGWLANAVAGVGWRSQGILCRAAPLPVQELNVGTCQVDSRALHTEGTLVGQLKLKWIIPGCSALVGAGGSGLWQVIWS